MIYIVAAYLKSNDRFLICKRTHGELKGYWEFPGGKIEEGESVFDAIKRELTEELNITINPLRILHNFIYPYSFGNVSLLLIECILSPLNQKIVSDGSHSNFAWIDDSKKKKRFAPLDQKVFEYIISTKRVS